MNFKDTKLQRVTDYYFFHVLLNVYAISEDI
jgi:hypothetical protein